MKNADSIKNIKNPGKRRPVVAFLNGNIHDSHSRNLIKLLYDKFRDDDIDFHYYLGADLNGFLGVKVTSNLKAEYHYYALFSYLWYDSPDIIVLSMGGLTNSDVASGVADIIARLPKVPIIMLENETEHPGVTHVLIENYSGMKQLIEHLISEHGCKRIAHLAGPLNNNDASLRIRAWEDALSEHGLEKGMMVRGDYTRNVVKQAEELLDSHPEAIVCANDIMAQTVYRCAAARGLSVGRDLLVTGFDDSIIAGFMEPPLSTVRQDLENVSTAVVEQVRNFLNGQGVADVTISAKPVIRQSCGCMIGKTHMHRAGQQFIEHDNKIAEMILQSMESAVTLRNMLFQEMDMKGIFNVLGETLARLGARRSYVLLHDGRPISRERRELVDPEDCVRLVMRQENEGICSYDIENAPLVKKGGFRAAIQNEDKSRLTDFVLFYQKYEYGVLIADIDPDQVLFFYSLSLEIGSGMRYLQISKSRQEARLALEEKNQILNYAATHDPLTRLYNRAGIMNEIYGFVRSFPRNNRFLLVMADLDHLKQINDGFGHTAGDNSICAAAELLKKTFPAESPIGRNGGDEFIGVMRLDYDGQEEDFLQNLRLNCREFNEKEEIPYYVEISAGSAEFGGNDLNIILKVIEEADKVLYEAKKTRRRNVVKEK